MVPEVGKYYVFKDLPILTPEKRRQVNHHAWKEVIQIGYPMLCTNVKFSDSLQETLYDVKFAGSDYEFTLSTDNQTIEEAPPPEVNTIDTEIHDDVEEL